MRFYVSENALLDIGKGLCAFFYACPYTANRLKQYSPTPIYVLGVVIQYQIAYAEISSTRNHRAPNDQTQHQTQSTIRQYETTAACGNAETAWPSKAPNLNFPTDGTTSLLSPFGGL